MVLYCLLSSPAEPIACGDAEDDGGGEDREDDAAGDHGHLRGSLGGRLPLGKRRKGKDRRHGCPRRRKGGEVFFQAAHTVYPTGLPVAVEGSMGCFLRMAKTMKG